MKKRSINKRNGLKRKGRLIIRRKGNGMKVDTGKRMAVKNITKGGKSTSVIDLHLIQRNFPCQMQLREMTKGRESTNGDELHLIHQKVHLDSFHVSTNMTSTGRKRSIREFLRLFSLFQVYETHGQLSEELLSFVPEFLASVYFCMPSIDAKA